MSKSPYFQVYLKDRNKDITELISSFVYEDCLNQDDLLKITMNDIYAEFIDDPDLIEGTDLVFQFGYLSFKITSASVAQIKKIEPDYGASLNLTITCLDKGNSFKEDRSNKIWKNMTGSDIVAQICNRYGIELESDPTKKVYTNLPQGNRTDFDFIRYLTTIEESGSYIFYIKDFKAYFIKRDLKKEPKILYTWRSPDDTKVISFKPVFNEAKKNKAKKGAKLFSVDPKSGDVITADANPENDSSEGFLGNQFGILTPKGKNKDAKNTAPAIVTAAIKDKAHATNVVKNVHKKAAKAALTATLVLEGDTLPKAGDIIGIAGVSKKYSGNWYCVKVRHEVTSSGFITTLDLEKNATNAPVTKSQKAPAKDINKGVGSENPDSKKKVFVYDQYGKQKN